MASYKTPVNGSELYVVVPGGRAVEQHGLRLKERQHPVDAALAADAGLLDPPVPHVEVRLEAVVADGPGPHLPGHLAGPVDVGREDRAVQPEDGVVGDAHGARLVAGG